MAPVQSDDRSEETGQSLYPPPACNAAPQTAWQGRFTLFIVVLVLGFIVNTASGVIFSKTSFKNASGSIAMGLYGIVLLLSLLKKPLFYYFAVNMRGGKDPVRREQIKQMWQQSARYRSSIYTLTTTWGISLLLGATLYVYCAYNETAAQFQVVSSIVRWGTIVVLLLGTYLYISWRRSKGNASSSL